MGIERKNRDTRHAKRRSDNVWSRTKWSDTTMVLHRLDSLVYSYIHVSIVSTVSLNADLG